MKKAVWAFVTAFVLVLATTSSAFAVANRTGDHVLIGPDETIDDDLISNATTLDVLGHIRGDLIAFGTEVNVGGEVDGDVLVAASKVTITGTVHGNVRTVTMSLTSRGKIDRNLMAFAQQATIAPESSIGGNVELTGSQLDLAGDVGRGVMMSAAAATVNAHVARDVDATVPSLTVGSQARIDGKLTYVSDTTASIPSGAVAGAVTRTTTAEARHRQQGPDAGSLANILRLFWLIGNVVLGLLAVHFLPGVTRASRLALTKRTVPAFAAGAAFCIGVPVLAALALLTIIGMPVGLLALATWVAVLELGWVFAAAALATTVIARVQQGQATAPQEVLVTAGLLVLFLLTRLPIIGGPIWLIVLCLGAGALLQAAGGLRRVPTTHGALESQAASASG